MSARRLDPLDIQRHVDGRWPEVIDRLEEFISIPNVSPAFDDEWASHGHMDDATELVRSWCAGRPIDGMTVDVQHLDGRTPLVVCEIPGTSAASTDATVILYGHLDKQPEMSGWRDGLSPWTPVLDGDRLYGRGGADDGYAAFAALTAIESLRESGGQHCRLLVLIEASEESGSPDLPAHLDALGDRLGQVSLVIGLDSGAATYDRLWVTTSLRGVLLARVRVDVLTEGVHSGSAGGIVPSSFRLLRQILDRVEDSATGRVLVASMWADVPSERADQLDATAAEIIDGMHMPWSGSTQPDPSDPVAAQRARTWEPSIATIAMDGFPPTDRAGNVLRPFSTATLACRLAPTADPVAAGRELTQLLITDPPNGASVDVEIASGEAGWNAPPTAPWLRDAIDQSSRAYWGRPAGAMGEGGTIPFMGMLGAQFPDAQFLICGVLGPQSNAHGPNEFLHLPMALRITCTVASVLHAHAAR